MKQQSIAPLLKAPLRRIDRVIFSPFYDHFVRVLERECVNNCETLLDIGFGQHSPIDRFSKKLKHTVGVDVFEPAIEESKKLKIHSEYKMMDLRGIYWMKS